MIGLWSQLLHAVPTSRLVMMTGAGKAADQRVLNIFRHQQIDPERITLVGRQRREAYFQIFHQVDLCLDTYPFTGCNTTADSLWMGVPVVTLAGPSCTTRQGIAVLFQAGLEEFVAETPAEYLGLATRLADDLAYLEKLRGQLRLRLEQALLTDVPRHTRNIEAAYREMWRRYCR
jgi:predicted O-linked N-acetylglucosamine transferase (SPINDLY family)